MANNNLSKELFRSALSAQKKFDTSQVYSKIIIYSGRKLTFALIVSIFIVSFSYLLFKDLSLAEPPHWLAMGAPLIFACSLLLLFPPTEQWEYKPWQAKAQQVERHFLD